MKRNVVDVSEVIGRITLTAHVNKIELKNTRRAMWRLRISMWIMHFAAFVGGWNAAEKDWE